MDQKKYLILLGAVWGLTSACGKLTEDQLKQAINNATQNNPISYESVSDTDLKKLVSQALVTPAESTTASTSYVIKASKQFRPATVFSDYKAEFISAKKMQIPKLIPVTVGKSGNHWVTLRFTNLNTSSSNDVTCVYKGQGSTSSSATCGTTSTNGSNYDFQYCMKTSDYSAKGCSSNPWKSTCNVSSLFENIDPNNSAKNIIDVLTLSLTVNNGDSGGSCTKTEIQMTFNVPKVNVLSCNMVVDSNVVLDDHLVCLDSDKLGLVVRGNGLSLDGNSKTIQLLKAKIGVLVLGNNVNLNNLGLIGDNSGVGYMFYNSSNVTLSNLFVHKRWVGFDIINSLIATQNDNLFVTVYASTRNRAGFE